ncbi:MAG: hypothetical protein KKH54_14710, partial [Alphaproteobacteria bacterium]|nr:hypothetical protein [Alphaproteobacteria bacterium]
MNNERRSRLVPSLSGAAHPAKGSGHGKIGRAPCITRGGLRIFAPLFDLPGFIDFRGLPDVVKIMAAIDNGEAADQRTAEIDERGQAREQEWIEGFDHRAETGERLCGLRDRQLPKSEPYQQAGDVAKALAY